MKLDKIILHNKIHIVFDKTKHSLKVKNLLEKKIKACKLNSAELIVVLGGDGFMLETLKKLHKLKKSFYGLNTGNYGFLMNRLSVKDFLKNLKTSKEIRIHPLQMNVLTKKNQTKKSIAINEVSVLRQGKQAASISIQFNKKNNIKRLISDGVLISSPAGSTAYNLSVHGPILNLNSNKLAVTPISPFRPRRWRGVIISDKSIVTIKNLEKDKRPISVTADNFEVRNAIKVIIKANKKITFNLLYNKNNSLHKKIKIEQVRKEILNRLI